MAGEDRVVKGHADLPLSISIARGGATQASASGDGTVRLWDLPREEAMP